jgi:hypothetical protein
MAQAKYSPLLSCGLFCTPLNTIGIGNPMTPQAKVKKTTGIGDTGKDFVDQEEGSGDLVV